MATNEHIIRLSAIDQSVTRVYIRLALVYECRSATTLEIAKWLGEAVKSTITRFPVLAGVVRPTNDPTNTQKGRLEIMLTLNRVKSFLPYPKNTIGEQGINSYDAMIVANVPAFHLMNRSITPLEDAPAATEAPVFSVQANMVPQGVIVALYLHHAVGDMTTLQMIIADLSSGQTPHELSEEYVRGEALQQSSMRDRLAGSNGHRSGFANDDRFNKITITATSRMMLQPNLQTPDNVAFLYSFDLGKIEQLKALVASRPNDISAPATTQSTSFSILCAILWKGITRARMVTNVGIPAMKFAVKLVLSMLTEIQGHNVKENEARLQTSTLMTAVNFRGKIQSMGDRDYFGNAFLQVHANLPIENLNKAITATGIGEAARAVTEATSSIFEGRVRSTIAAINEASDVSKIDMKGMALASDLAIWNWSDLNLSSATLGLGLGAPRWARQISQNPNSFTGCIVHTKREDMKQWDVTVQLPMAVMQNLGKDRGLQSFVERFS